MLQGRISLHLDSYNGSEAWLLNRSWVQGKRGVENHFVMNAGHPVQQLVDLSSLANAADRLWLKDQRYKWENIFRDLQSLNYMAIPHFVEQEGLSADSLFLLGERLFLIWQKPGKALFLGRQGRFYRVQPCARAVDIFPPRFMAGLDFYALSPMAGDRLLQLDSDLVLSFPLDFPEKLLAEGLSAGEMVSRMLKEVRLYNPAFDVSCLAFDVLRLEENLIIQRSRRLEDQGAEGHPDDQWLNDVGRSKAVRWLENQEVYAPDEREARRFAQENLNTQRLSQRLKRRAETNRDEEDPILSFEHRRAVRKRYEARRSDREALYDRLRNFSFEPLLRKWKHRVWRWIHRWSPKAWLSRLISAAILVLALCAVLLLFRFVKGGSDDVAPGASAAQSSTVAYDPSAIVLPPHTTDMEILHVVKAQQLHVHQQANVKSIIVATLKRGDKVLQLAPQNGGWIYIRVEATQIEGYVYADYLLHE